MTNLSEQLSEYTIAEAAPTPKSWEVSDSVLFLLAYFFAQFFFYSLFTTFVPQPKGVERLYFNVGVTLLSNLAIVGLFFIQGRSIHRMSWDELGFCSVPWKQALKYGVIFFGLVFAFNFLYGFVLKWMRYSRPTQQVATLFSSDNPWTLQAFAFLMVVISAPLTEELMYRGVIFSSAKTNMEPIPAAILAGLLFGLLHFETKTIIPLGFLGFLLCYIYHKTKSLWLCIGLHAINNSLAYVWLMYFKK